MLGGLELALTLTFSTFFGGGGMGVRNAGAGRASDGG